METCIQARNSTRHARIEAERPHLRALLTRPCRCIGSPMQSSRERARCASSNTDRMSAAVTLARRHRRARLQRRARRGHGTSGGRDAHRIGYRHIVHALVRKPGAEPHDRLCRRYGELRGESSIGFQHFSVYSETRFTPYALVNVRAGLRIDPWTANLYANNATNRPGVLSGGTFPLTEVNYLTPRTRISLSRTF
jgi:hypothetical protein